MRGQSVLSASKQAVMTPITSSSLPISGTETIDWYFSLVDKGYVNPYGAFADPTSTDTMLGSGAIAMALQGDWMFNTFAQLDINVGFIERRPRDKAFTRELDAEIARQAKSCADILDLPAGQVRRQSGADGFDFGQFGHEGLHTRKGRCMIAHPSILAAMERACVLC